MRGLVIADRDQVNAWQQDIGDLAHRVCVEPDRAAFHGESVQLALESRVAFEHPERSDEAEQHRQFSEFRDVALDHERRSFGVEADRQPVERDLQHRITDQVDVVEVVAKRLVVGDQEVALVLVLQFDPVVQCADVVTDMQRAGGPDTGKNSLFSFSYWRCHVVV